MICGLLLLAGMYLLAAAMSPHRTLLPARVSAALSPRLARRVGWLLVALSFVVAAGRGRWIDIVTWFGLAPLCGGVVLALCTMRARKRSR